ncbi:MAG: TonB-dependent receptor, partial [Acidobacteria bacterium]|nr:TonB-dependent receptor [Acidobacteriota bacterium]
MRFGVLFWVILLHGASLAAQQTDASISGTVTDATGAAVPNAEVAVLNAATGTRLAVRTNESGFYSLRPLAIGSYSLSAELSGFRKHQQRDIVLTTGQSAEIDIRLQPGDVKEVVEVVSNQVMLETRTSDASQLIESKMIAEMPMGDRRAFNMLEITGGTVFVPNETGGSPTFALAGGRVGSQMYFVDGGGGQNMRVGVPGSNVDPPIDTLSEVRIMSNGFSAEFGASAGGVVVMNTKSGTNRIHGTVSEYFRNQILDAPRYDSPIVDGRRQKPALRYNVFGGTVGGPIIRDRTFYFLSHESSLRGDGSVRTLTVPSLLERNGDFSRSVSASGVLAPIYDPYSSRLSATGALQRTAFPGNILPRDRWDRVGAQLADFYPVPNRTPDDATGANNFRANNVTRRNRQNMMVKIDHAITDRNKVTGRLMWNMDNSYASSVYPIRDADTVNNSDGHTWFYYGSFTRIVSPSIVNELRFTYNTRYFRSYSAGTGGGWNTKLGLKALSDEYFPNFAPAGYAALGTTTQDRQQMPILQYQFVESLSWIRGKHSFRFGGEYRPSQNTDILRSTVSGRFTFNRGLTGLSSANTGNGFATALLGIPSLYDTRETDKLIRRTTYAAWYVQDDWELRPNFTLNIGLRWEIDTPVKDVNNRMNGFDMTSVNPVSGTPGIVKFHCLNDWRCSPYDADLNNFGPRIGFAWRPFNLKHTVVRAGFGVFFAHPFDGTVANSFSLGYERSSQANIVDSITSVPYTISNNLPVPNLTPRPLTDTFGAVAVGTTPTTSVTFLESNRRAGYSLQDNFRIQHQLRGNAILEYGYVGNASRKISAGTLNINQIRPETVKATQSQRDRPFPQFSNVQVLQPSMGVSSYHSGVVKYEKRFSRGFNLLSTYTFAKTLDNMDSRSSYFGNETNSYSNYYNRRADYGPSEIDIRHRFTFSSVYQFPFGRGRRFLSQHFLRHIAGGWSTGGVFVVQSGGPLTVTTLTNNTQSYSSGPQRADVLRDPNLPGGERTLRRWFDTSAFVQPATGRFGNQGVGLVRGPGYVSLNASLIRRFSLGERIQLHFRGEMQNLPNHPNLGLPATQFQGAGFGIINTARPARQVQLGIRLV